MCCCVSWPSTLYNLFGAFGVYLWLESEGQRAPTVHWCWSWTPCLPVWTSALESKLFRPLMSSKDPSFKTFLDWYSVDLCRVVKKERKSVRKKEGKGEREGERENLFHLWSFCHLRIFRGQVWLRYCTFMSFLQILFLFVISLTMRHFIYAVSTRAAKKTRQQSGGAESDELTIDVVDGAARSEAIAMECVNGWETNGNLADRPPSLASSQSPGTESIQLEVMTRGLTVLGRNFFANFQCDCRCSAHLHVADTV